MLRFFLRLRWRSLVLILGECCSFLAAGERVCQAHPYFPLTKGATKVVSYGFSVEDATITPPPEKGRGEITMHTDRFEEKVPAGPFANVRHCGRYRNHKNHTFDFENFV